MLENIENRIVECKLVKKVGHTLIILDEKVYCLIINNNQFIDLYTREVYERYYISGADVIKNRIYVTSVFEVDFQAKMQLLNLAVNVQKYYDKNLNGHNIVDFEQYKLKRKINN